jgi:hypothetical protein
VWLDGDPLEVTGLDSHGSIRACSIRPAIPEVREATPGWAFKDGPFRVFARIRAELYAGVTCTGVHWLRNWRHKSAGSSEAPMTPMSFTRPVAAFVLPATADLLVVEADCTLTRVPIRD